MAHEHCTGGAESQHIEVRAEATGCLAHAAEHASSGAALLCRVWVVTQASYRAHVRWRAAVHAASTLCNGLVAHCALATTRTYGYGAEQPADPLLGYRREPPIEVDLVGVKSVASNA